MLDSLVLCPDMVNGGTIGTAVRTITMISVTKPIIKAIRPRVDIFYPVSTTC